MAEKQQERQISASLFRLRMASPFFAALSLFATYRSSYNFPTAATDGKNVFYNPDFLDRLSGPHLDFVMLHEILHAALLHPGRRGAREPVRWNIAADIVVNGLIANETSFEILPGSVREKKLESYSAEEIYALLDSEQVESCKCLASDLVYGEAGPNWKQRIREFETHWRNALHQAEYVARLSQGHGTLSAGMERLLAFAKHPQVDWRTRLWRYLVRTPTDYGGFDRRFVYQGIYLENLEGESVRVYVAVDTSGSISDTQLGIFLREVMSISSAYPHMEVLLYYADASLFGPYPLHKGELPAQPEGGGGTSFVPFFDAISKELSPLSETVCVYLTDGYGTFPEKFEAPVLWVVTPGGLQSKSFPFGDVVRLIELK